MILHLSKRCRRWIYTNWLLIFLLAVCITRLWLMPLPSSFWTDEAGTAFVVQRQADPSLAVASQVPASIYYVFPRIADRLFGFSEISYRIPSILLMAIALFIIGRLSARLIHPGAAWFAVFACLAMADFNFYAIDARPYALGICVTAASLYFLIEWLDTARFGYRLCSSCFPLALLWRTQLVFWAFYPVFPIYTLVRLLCPTTARSHHESWLVARVLRLLPACPRTGPRGLRCPFGVTPDCQGPCFCPRSPASACFLWRASRWEWIALATPWALFSLDS